MNRTERSAPGGRRRRPLVGVLVGLGVLAVVAVPAGWCGFAAYVAGITGWNGDPEPAVGLLWGSMAAVLLALPVVAGLLAARVRLVRLGGWGRSRATALVVVVVLLVLVAVGLVLWARTVV